MKQHRKLALLAAAMILSSSEAFAACAISDFDCHNRSPGVQSFGNSYPAPSPVTPPAYLGGGAPLQIPAPDSGYRYSEENLRRSILEHEYNCRYNGGYGC